MAKPKLIALDAGHGGRDPGACANGIVEKNFALDMVVRIGHHLRLRGLKTVLTRDSDVYVGINKRASVARLAGADLFLSIHCNAAGNPAAAGSEAFIAAPDNRSGAIARTLLHRIAGLKPRGAKKDNQSQHSSLGVLRGTYRQMPAVLLELGFCTNLGDAELMKDKNQRELWAKEVAVVIVGSLS